MSKVDKAYFENKMKEAKSYGFVVIICNDDDKEFESIVPVYDISSVTDEGVTLDSNSEDIDGNNVVVKDFVPYTKMLDVQVFDPNS